MIHYPLRTACPTFFTAFRVFTCTAALALAAPIENANCEERKTLLQWSYGTSFEGGPDLSEPLVTDRPDFTESTVTVGRGVMQLECGYTFTADDEAGVRTNNHSFPETLLRVGMLAEWFELRFDWNYAYNKRKLAAPAIPNRARKI